MNVDRAGPLSKGTLDVIRLSKLADYGIVIATHMARHGDGQLTTPEIAVATAIPQPMASKILKLLTRADVLASHRGVKGGYGLARPAADITVAEVIEALEGPIAITSCLDEAGPGEDGDCSLVRLCPARANWQRINGAIRVALESITLAEMAQSIPFAFLLPGERPTLAAAGLQALPETM